MSEPELRYGIIEVTTRCQLRCQGCYMVRRDALNGRQMSLEQAVRVLDLCREWRGGRDLESMDILGGDPLLWPHLQEYVEELLRRNIAPWIFTNMLKITPEMAQWLYEHKVKVTGKMNMNPADMSQLALQARMVGRSKLTAQKMVQAVQVFLDAGYRYPDFFLENLLRRDNIASVSGFYRWCLERKIGADIEMLACGEGTTPEYAALAPTMDQIVEMIQQLRALREEYGLKNGNVLMPHIFGGCRFYDSGLYFGVDGHIRACSNSAMRLATVTDPDPIRQAWGSGLLSRRRMLNRHNVGAPCDSCDRWSECRGGCRATVEGAGDPFGGYSLCPVPYLRE